MAGALGLASGLDPRVGAAPAQVVGVGQTGAGAVVGGLAQDRSDGVVFTAVAGQRDEGLVEAQRVELEAVVAQDPDAVEVTLGDVLEGAGLDAEAGDQLVAVERALAQALALEGVGDLLDRGGRLGERETADRLRWMASIARRGFPSPLSM